MTEKYFLHPKSKDVVTASVASTGVSILNTFRLSTAPLNINGTQTLRTLAPKRRLSESMTLK